MTTIPGMDEASYARLVALLQAHDLVDAHDEVTVRHISGGRSNITYRIDTAARSLVLRRPPLGHVLSTAHDMSREYRVLTGLGQAHERIPVPATHVMCDDTEIIGAPFYVMDYVPGDVLRTADQALSVTSEQQHRLGEDLTDVLAALHMVDPDAVGLGDFGRPAGFMERQVRRWTRQLELSRSRDLPDIERFATLLSETVPEQHYSSIVHGDYRLDNCLVRDGAIAAVLDWEMSTLGDPLSDVGLFFVYHAGLSGIDNPVVTAIDGLGAYPPIATLLDRYADRTGFDLADLGWYIAFGWFKLAVICEGIHYRETLGETLGGGFEGVAELVGPCIERGLAALNERTSL
jgi:aminoglycoside phosphotransferase (APT) family kinase protein